MKFWEEKLNSYLQGARGIANFAVADSCKAPEGATSVLTKLSFELDLNGLVRCTSATHHHRVDVVETQAPTADAAPAGDTAMSEGAEADNSATGEAPLSESGKGENGDASNMETDAPGQVSKPKKKGKKVC